MTSDLLRTVVAAARRAAEIRAERGGAAKASGVLPAPRGEEFAARLRRPGINVIAECKRRSPSRGVLRPAYDPAAIARDYARAGAAAVSVLTEPTFFDGSLDHLRAVRHAVDLPVLRKDFIVTDFQVDESVAAGADAILLIVGALEPHELRALIARARQAGLAALVEVHDHDELAVALDAGATIVGVNSRDLRTLDVKIETFDDLARELPPGVVTVAESGLRNGADLARLHALRYDAFLIGERFMTEPSPGDALDQLRRAAEEGVR
ncbi:MAG: indole-3-glycerol phosphate synthase TrpC [Vicinamibacterales bacterium]